MVKSQVTSDIIHVPDIFKGLTKSQYTTIAANGVHKTLDPKTILFHQGHPAAKCFLVNKGRLKLTKLNEQGKEVIIRYIGPGELTAAAAVIKDRQYPVTAESVGRTTVTKWNKSDFLMLLRTYPDITINLLGVMMERIEEVQQRYLEVCTEHVEQRIARSLLRLMRRAGTKTPEGILIDIPLTRENVAEYSGTTLYTVSRTLSAWKKKGWVLSTRERIIVTNPHALVVFSENG